MVYRDLTGQGRTVVHDVECDYIGSTSTTHCDCPRRMSYESVRTLRHTIKGAYEKWGRKGAYITDAATGNPADSGLAEQYVAWVREEQVRANVSQKQAMPVLTDKLMDICKRLSHVVSAPRCTVYDRLVARRDCAWYTLAQNSAVRNGQIGATLLANVVDLHDRMLFEWQ